MANDDFDLRYPTDRKVSKRAEAQRRFRLERLESMQRKYGKGPVGRSCGSCAHLVGVGKANVYFKCELYGVSSSDATDWRKKWQACGAFKPEAK